MNNENQEMKKYKIFLVPMGNNKITWELELKACNDSVTTHIKKKNK